MGVVFWLATFALFAVLGWKFWHGQWLRLIAGNNLVSDRGAEKPLSARPRAPHGRGHALLLRFPCGARRLLVRRGGGRPVGRGGVRRLGRGGHSRHRRSLHLGRSLGPMSKGARHAADRRARGKIPGQPRTGGSTACPAACSSPFWEPTCSSCWSWFPWQPAGARPFRSLLAFRPLPRGGRTLLRRTRWVAPGTVQAGRAGAGTPAGYFVMSTGTGEAWSTAVLTLPSMPLMAPSPRLPMTMRPQGSSSRLADDGLLGLPERHAQVDHALVLRDAVGNLLLEGFEARLLVAAERQQHACSARCGHERGIFHFQRIADATSPPLACPARIQRARERPPMHGSRVPNHRMRPRSLRNP